MFNCTHKQPVKDSITEIPAVKFIAKFVMLITPNGDIKNLNLNK